MLVSCTTERIDSSVPLLRSTPGARRPLCRGIRLIRQKGSITPVSIIRNHRRLVGAAHQVVVAAVEAQLLSAECCTAPDHEGRIYDVGGGRIAAEKDLLMRRLPERSGVHDNRENVFTAWGYQSIGLSLQSKHTAAQKRSYGMRCETKRCLRNVLPSCASC